MERRLSYAEKGKGKAHYSDDNKRRVRIKAPELDTSRKIKENELTLIGRLTNPQEQEMREMITFLTRHWNLKGRSEGSEIGEGCFQFRFEREDDLQQVLENRPYTFARWMVILEKWEPVISSTFPSEIPFWIRLYDLPLHYWQEEMVKKIGEKAGRLDGVEITTTYARARVTVDGLQPILRETVVDFPNGDEVTVGLEYERLEKFCNFCNRLTHQEKDCLDKRREREERDQTRILNRSSRYADREPHSNIRQREERRSFYEKERACDFDSRRDICGNNFGERIVERNQREWRKRGLKGTTQGLSKSGHQHRNKLRRDETDHHFRLQNNFMELTPRNVEISNLSKRLPLKRDLNQLDFPPPLKIPKVMEDLRGVIVESAARARRVSQGEERNLMAARSRKRNACVDQNPRKRRNTGWKDQTLTIEAQNNSSLSLPSPQYSSSPQSSLSRNWEHNVFPSFHGPDVRERFLSHMLKEFINKGIDPFIDNNIKRSKSIGPELERAIRGSKIGIVLLSKNYASSSWCLDELVNIMKCREVLGQKVMTIFYEVDPTDIKKQSGHFGKAFKETCQGKTKEKIETWRKALEDVATIAGYHSKIWDNEAAMIEKISTNVSNMLNISPCSFDRYIGMGTHIEKMKRLLRMDSDEVRMIGIWGPPGIGKSTIARFLFHKLSNKFQLSANMNVKETYPRSCRNEYNAQVQLQSLMLSHMLNQHDLMIPHLGVAKQRLNDKNVLLVLDDVDQVEQLEALARNIQWFGRGSRIIIVTEDIRVLRAHGINHIYTVDLPSDDKALQIFCMSAFDHKYPEDGFKDLAWQVVCHIGKLPLGLKVMGSYFRGMSKQEWKNALPKVWRSLDINIESVLKFSYDALDDEDKDLFLHIACLFTDEESEKVEEYLLERFPYVRHGLNVLAQKSLIYQEPDGIFMESLLVKFGREIVRKQSPDKLEKRQFLVDSSEICKLFDASGSKKVIGINCVNFNVNDLNISVGALEGMSNLQFLYLEGGASQDTSHLPHGLSYLSPKLRLLHWKYFPMRCLSFNVNLEFLVELHMRLSKLEKLWEGIKRLPNLKWMDLLCSKNLKEIPDLSTATKLEELNLAGCSSLMEIPNLSTATKLQELNLGGCSSLVKLHSSIGNATNLEELNLNGCSSLVELPASIGNLDKLQRLYMEGCSKLKFFPINVNLKSLIILDLRGCSSLVKLPSSIGNATIIK